MGDSSAMYCILLFVAYGIQVSMPAQLQQLSLRTDVLCTVGLLLCTRLQAAVWPGGAAAPG
jgi:hypothetical protein